MNKISLTNLGTVNKNRVNIGDLTLYFSYQTIVSYRTPAEQNTIKNYWGTTTGKLLNEIEPNKTARLDKEEFENRLNKLLKDKNLAQ